MLAPNVNNNIHIYLVIDVLNVYHRLKIYVICM